MDRKFQTSMQITPSMCDASACLGIPNTFGLFMDIATIHAESIGLGAKAMMRQGLFWLTVRTRIRFHRRPLMMEPVTAATWPGKPDQMRCMRYYTLAAADQTLLAEGKTEWAVVEMKTGKLHNVAGLYPSELELTEEAVCGEPFTRFNKDFSACPENEAFARTVIAAFMLRMNPTLEEMGDVKARVTADYQESMEKDWIKKLRAKYPVEVKWEMIDKLNITPNE